MLKFRLAVPCLVVREASAEGSKLIRVQQLHGLDSGVRTAHLM